MTGLPVAGRDGTLAGRMNGTPAAGYVRTRDGETLAFAIMADSFEGPGSAATEAIDRIAVRLADFSRTAN